MAKYFIPQRFKEGFKLLLSLNDESTKILISKLNDFEVGGGMVTFRNFMHSLPIVNIDDISETIFSFGGLLNNKDGDDDKQIANDLIDSLNLDSEETLDKDKRNDYLERLLVIFENSQNIKISYKALMLSNDVPRIFNESKIISDIRVIFGDEIESDKKFAVVSHQLKIDLIEDSREKSIHINMDIEDLKKLRNQIDRAFVKDALMKQEFSPVINFINTTD